MTCDPRFFFFFCCFVVSLALRFRREQRSNDRWLEWSQAINRARTTTTQWPISFLSLSPSPSSSFSLFFGRPRTVQLAGNGRRTLTPSVELRRNSVRIEIRRLCGWTCGNILATGSLFYKVVGDFLNFFRKFEIWLESFSPEDFRFVEQFDETFLCDINWAGTHTHTHTGTTPSIGAIRSRRRHRVIDGWLPMWKNSHPPPPRQLMNIPRHNFSDAYSSREIYFSPKKKNSTSFTHQVPPGGLGPVTWPPRTFFKVSMSQDEEKEPLGTATAIRKP